jgi:hypothetical protein
MAINFKYTALSPVHATTFEPTGAAVFVAIAASQRHSFACVQPIAQLTDCDAEALATTSTHRPLCVGLFTVLLP